MQKSRQNKIFIIAEAGVNHNGKMGLALELIEAAVNAGADAVKFQTFKSELIANMSTERARYQKENIPDRIETQFEMIQRLELSYASFAELKRYCDQRKILFLTSTGEIPSTKKILNLVPLFKIGSADITNIPFLEYLASQNKPIILSTGMSRLGEIENAVEILSRSRPKPGSSFPPLTLLHCTTNYPCPFDEVNLKAIVTLQAAFRLPVGYSDHTLGIEVPIAAAALGAQVIEKHFTLDRNLPGPDHKASLEPDELRAMVRAIRHIEVALGDGDKRPNKSEEKIMKVSRKSIVARYPIKAGTAISRKMIVVKRPGTGIPPGQLKDIIGMNIRRDKKADDVFEWKDFHN
jgi:N-acetylneuraminate synthase/N,N'-diacetyllegionaminate synthase